MNSGMDSLSLLTSLMVVIVITETSWSCLQHLLHCPLLLLLGCSAFPFSCNKLACENKSIARSTYLSVTDVRRVQSALLHVWQQWGSKSLPRCLSVKPQVQFPVRIRVNSAYLNSRPCRGYFEQLSQRSWRFSRTYQKMQLELIRRRVAALLWLVELRVLLASIR